MHHPDTETMETGRSNKIRPNPIPMKEVQLKVTHFHGKMQKLAKLAATSAAFPELQFDTPEEFMMQFYIDKAGLDRLVNISNQQDFDKLGVFFGLEDVATQKPLADPNAKGFGRLTCCFVGLDANQDVLAVHFPSPTTGVVAVEAEDTWPPPPPPPPHPATTLSLANAANDVFDFFEP